VLCVEWAFSNFCGTKANEMYLMKCTKRYNNFGRFLFAIGAGFFVIAHWENRASVSIFPRWSRARPTILDRVVLDEANQWPPLVSGLAVPSRNRITRNKMVNGYLRVPCSLHARADWPNTCFKRPVETLCPANI